MDSPEHLGEGEFAELLSIEGESPTSDAWLRIEWEGTKVDVTFPSGNASQLLDAAVAALLVAAASFAPAVTLKAAPGDLPHWALVGMIALQLGVVILVAVHTFTTKPGSPNRLPG